MMAVDVTAKNMPKIHPSQFLCDSSLTFFPERYPIKMLTIRLKFAIKDAASISKKPWIEACSMYA